MSELRKDLITREWVIINAERAKRTSHFPQPQVQDPAPLADDTSLCPFEAGNEHLTPPEIASYRSPDTQRDTPGWWVRVVPNKYPALAIEGDLERTDMAIYDAMKGVGAHEVIIETPEHNKSLARLDAKQVEEVVWMYRDRYLDLKKDHRLQYIMIFRNHGRAAGATLGHPHSQLIATPFIPQAIANEIAGANRYAEYHERCAYCDVILNEVAAGERLVAANPSFVSLEPYAARYPFETWILPKRHSANFADMTRQELREFSAMLKETLLRIDLSLKNPPYNFFIHTAPCNADGEDSQRNYHWHLEIAPRLTVAAGFELGTVIYINITPPEEAAQLLREVDLSGECQAQREPSLQQAM